MMGFCGSLSFLWFHDTILMDIRKENDTRWEPGTPEAFGALPLRI